MAKNTQMSNLAVNTEANALAALADGGKMHIFTGSQPGTADNALSGQTLLARVTLGTPAFGSAVAGVLTAEQMTGEEALADGDAAWFRLYKADGTTALWDGTVGTTNANLTVPTTTFITGVFVDCASFTHTVGKYWTDH